MLHFKFKKGHEETKNNGVISKLIGKYSAGHLSSWIQNYIKVN